MVEGRTEVRLGEIGQIALTVGDLARSTFFYRETLGMTFLFDAGSMVFFRCGTVRLLLGLAETEVSPGGAVLYFRVGDIAAVHEELAGRGVRFQQGPHLVAKMPDHELWMAFFRDPDENVLALLCERPVAV